MIIYFLVHRIGGVTGFGIAVVVLAGIIGLPFLFCRTKRNKFLSGVEDYDPSVRYF